MDEVTVIDVKRMPDGTEYRAVMRRYEEQEAPYDDGQWPILQVSKRGHYSTHGAFNKAGEPYLDRYTQISGMWDDDEAKFERFLRMFCGTTQFRTYGPNQATDSTYIAFDTAAWREEVGVDVERLPGENPLSEIVAWIEGDVWCRAIETRYNPDENLEEDEDWVTHEDWVHGFYGEAWAESSGKDDLATAVENHKFVHRYPEHEKLQGFEKDISAIMEFLENLDGRNYRLAQVFDDSHNHLQSVPQSRHQRIVFEHFGISYNTIEQERALMFKRLREDAEQNPS